LEELGEIEEVEEGKIEVVVEDSTGPYEFKET